MSLKKKKKNEKPVEATAMMVLISLCVKTEANGRRCKEDRKSKDVKKKKEEKQERAERAER